MTTVERLQPRTLKPLDPAEVETKLRVLTVMKIMGALLGLGILGYVGTRAAVPVLVAKEALPSIVTSSGSRPWPLPSSSSTIVLVGKEMSVGPPASSSGQEQAASEVAGGKASDGRVVLNLANEQDLVSLPGIGPKRAQAILTLRQRIGKFRNVQDLLRVKGIGKRTLERLRPQLLVDPLPAPPSEGMRQG